jgi:hypothetical protein
MIHPRQMETYPVYPFDLRQSDPCGPVAQYQDAIARAGWAVEALAAARPECGPLADPVALLDLCHQRALDEFVPGSNRAVSGLGDAAIAIFLTVLSGFRAILGASSREPSFEQSVTGDHPDR